MGRTELWRYKKLLLEKQRELFPAEPTDSRVPPAGGFEGDLIDRANADAEAELQIRLHQADGHLLRAIEDALARLRQGRYGVCEMCERPISKVRLEAVPWARHCRDCKEQEHPAA